MASDETVDVKTRVQIMQDMLDRASLKGKAELEINLALKPWEQVMKGATEVVVNYDVTRDPDDNPAQAELDPVYVVGEVIEEPEPEEPSNVININPPLPAHLRPH
jgi:hypothetical protein